MVPILVIFLAAAAIAVLPFYLALPVATFTCLILTVRHWRLTLHTLDQLGAFNETSNAQTSPLVHFADSDDGAALSRVKAQL